MIRVLIADDSAFMRKVLSDVFNKEPDFEVVGTAADGKETVERVKLLKPDLLTLDVNMPVMDGINALAIIMREQPTPTVMISSLTQKGTDATVKALGLGAVDFISKKGGSISRVDDIEDEILAKCRAAAKANVRNIGTRPKSPVMRRVELPIKSGLQTERDAKPQEPTPGVFAKRQNPLLQRKEKAAAAKPAAVTFNSAGKKKLVAIGTSTGGPQALQKVITRLPANLPCGVVVVQHMPAGFTKSLADRLNQISAIAVKEAENDEVIEPGHVYIAPGNYHMRISLTGAERKIILGQDPPVGNHRPAVNVMYDSVAPIGRDLVAVIMTGMGCDGCEGMKKIKAGGGYSIAQNEDTSVVYGMPKAVVDAGLADEIRPLEDIAKAIVEAVNK
ncbi:MAG: chemotaxis response regulator protein-glutamate methylesterase [Selenomonadaceae bacterium]|nr:chemotaxis response regulator protein-glutamate methylesterase [Selenomonadaceae bacterium]